MVKFLENDIKSRRIYPDLPIIPHIGDSHCLSFAHKRITLNNVTKRVKPVYIVGAKAWHFANNIDNMFKSYFKKQIKNNITGDQVLISFGEIDCRESEGILQYSLKNNKNIKQVCLQTIVGYIHFMEENLSRVFKKRYYLGTPAPFIRGKEITDIDIKRKYLIETFNRILKKEVLSRDCYFIDIYRLTSDNGLNNNLYMMDDQHLFPSCLSQLIDNHIYEPDKKLPKNINK